MGGHNGGNGEAGKQEIKRHGFRFQAKTAFLIDAVAAGRDPSSGKTPAFCENASSEYRAMKISASPAWSDGDIKTSPDGAGAKKIQRIFPSPSSYQAKECRMCDPDEALVLQSQSGDPALTKIEMIERSMRCFDLGLLGLLPVIGIPMAVMALVQYRRVKLGQGALWNPAQRYWFWGGMCARAGLWPILIIAVLVGISARFL